MTTGTLSPVGVQKFFDNNGNPLAFGLIYTYQAGTTTLTPTYTDSTLGTANTNPIVLNFRGEAAIWLNPTQQYKFNVTDAAGNQVPGWPVDNILNGFTLSQNIVPTINNTFNLGSSSLAWAQLFIGPNGDPVYNTTFDTVGYTGRTAAEIAAGVTPVNYNLLPGVWDRYKTNTVPGTTDMTTGINNALAQWVQGGALPIPLNGVSYGVSSALNVPQGLILNLNRSTLVGLTAGVAVFSLAASIMGIVNGTINCNATGRGIYVPAPIQQFTFRDLRILCGTASGIEMVDCYVGLIDNVRLESGTGHSIYIRSTIAGTPTNSIILNRISQAGFTTAGDIIAIEGAAGIRVTNLDSENCNNAAGSNDIRIVANASNGTTDVVIDGAYFEDAINKVGNSIYVGDSAANTLTAIEVLNIYGQSSKQYIKIGAGVDNTFKATGNTFQASTGQPTAYAIATPANYVPNVYDNNGSLSDINRTFTPAITFGGAAVGVTYNVASTLGRYRRMGNRMFGEVQLVLTSKGTSTGLAVLTSLPIVSNANSLANWAQVVNYSNMASITAAIFGRIGPTATGISLSLTNPAASADIADVNFTNTASLNVQFGYEI